MFELVSDILQVISRAGMTVYRYVYKHVYLKMNIFFAKLKDKRVFFSKTIDFRKKLLRTIMS